MQGFSINRNIRAEKNNTDKRSITECQKKAIGYEYEIFKYIVYLPTAEITISCHK
jgi:hypothetical protein